MHRIIQSIVCLLGISAAAVAGDAQPSVWIDASPSEARRLAAEQERLLIVMGTASWCGPCRHMKATTWKDERVVLWVKEHAIAVQLDVDQYPGLARHLEIRAMPTTVLFRGDEELGRIGGARPAEPFVEWLTALREGREPENLDRSARPSIPELRERAAEDDMQARLNLARALRDAGELEEATDHYAWLWDNMTRVSPAMRGVRGSFMVHDMQRLAEQHPPAAERFRTLRDETEARLQPPPNMDHDVYQDWIALNRIVGESDRTDAWLEEHINPNPEHLWATSTPRRIMQMVNDRIREGKLREASLLIEDWAYTERDFVQILESRLKSLRQPQTAEVQDFVQSVKLRLKAQTATDGEDDNPLNQVARDHLNRVFQETLLQIHIEDGANLITVALLGDQPRTALRLVEVLEQHIDADDFIPTVVTTALRHSATHPMLLELLDRTEHPDEALRRRVENALAE
ncbi:MAG: hypothetical protein EA380_05415 [Phycisphaeraceae bacterium]|nr:MAG: hypothetical protein EA380_05415 [Phycisphaeraceae bacterium]